MHVNVYTCIFNCGALRNIEVICLNQYLHTCPHDTVSCLPQFKAFILEVHVHVIC